MNVNFFSLFRVTDECNYLEISIFHSNIPINTFFQIMTNLSQTITLENDVNFVLHKLFHLILCGLLNK